MKKFINNTILIIYFYTRHGYIEVDNGKYVFKTKIRYYNICTLY
jgi:hypothetical protein